MNDRPTCNYDGICYRLNPKHFEEFAHPKQDALKNKPNLIRKKEDSEEENDDSEEEEQPKKKVKSNSNWTLIDTLWVFSKLDAKGSSKVAAFDMDDTLIETKSGAKFPNGRKDWQWLDKEIPKKLKEIDKDGYKIVIFTNQAGVSKKKVNISDLKGKIEDIMSDLNIDLQAFIATDTDMYRKPNSTMWELFLEQFNEGVDVTESFYCGDAAGRLAGWKQGKKKDFSCSDRKFALNSCIPFLTPEEYFFGESPVQKFNWDGPDPKALLEKCKNNVLPNNIISNSQEMIIFVGCPASGKSSFTKSHFVKAGYERINRDTLKTKDKCLKVAETCLSQGKSVVIDNTNPNSSDREEYIKLAKKHKVPVRCFVMNTSLELAKHLNLLRERIFNIRRIPDIAYNMFRSKYEEPDLSEGFKEIKKIDFVPDFIKKEYKEFFFHRT